MPTLRGQRDPITATSTPPGRAEGEVTESNSVLPAPKDGAGWRRSCSTQPDPTRLTQAAKVGASPRAQGPRGLPGHHGCPFAPPHLGDVTSPRTAVLANLAAEPALQRKGSCLVCLRCRSLGARSPQQHPAELWGSQRQL